MTFYKCLPCILKKNHDRLRFSNSVPAQSGLVHVLNSALTRFSEDDKISKKKKKIRE